MDFESAYDWAKGANSKNNPHLLLGNGFSVAFNSAIFSYNALLDHARNTQNLTPVAEKFFEKLDTSDFEMVIQNISNAASALEVLDYEKHKDEVAELREEANLLKDLLAQTLASLHPERPMEIKDDVYLRVREFLNKHKNLYTANYDLLLYWTLMQENERGKFQASDDGFRTPEYEAEYVVWNHLNPHEQKLYYLHGALHLYRDTRNAELQKLTWTRTKDALIDQIREQLNNDRFPLIVAEGTSAEKLAKIQTSDYLSKGLRSLAAIGGGAIVYGLSFSENDAHISDALVKSKVQRVAVSLYGDPESDNNKETIQAANRLVSDRKSFKPSKPLEVEFFDSQSVPLW